ncbi:MAG: endonuclease NucS domain-containing protein, partial [Desulfurococcus sp.]|uniref:endonuclease NucS domain-containing protein n=1 Tax=Desulfurococcus sp. TaxID=51678 RepID=UPI003D1235C5
GVDGNGRPVIVELKGVPASRETVLQLYGYVKSYEAKYGRRPRGILVAPSFSPSAIEAL